MATKRTLVWGVWIFFGGIVLSFPLHSEEKAITEPAGARTLAVVAEKKGEVQTLIVKEEPTNDETVLRCLRSKLQALIELERAVLRVTIHFSIEKEERKAFLKRISGENPPSLPKDQNALYALLSKAEGEAVRIADEAYLCLNQESGGPVFPYSARTESPPENLPDLPLPLPQLFEPDPHDRPFSPVSP